jgi:hypothetical protein
MGSDTTQTVTLLEGGVQSWYDEIADYTFSSGACTAGAMCGHYTQVIWAETTTLGCGTATCAASTNAGAALGSEATVLVCNYAPPGNVGTQKPYIVGEACAACAGACEDGGLCTSPAASCADLSAPLTYNSVTYTSCAAIVAAEAGICAGWAEVGSTYCRLTCGADKRVF